MDVYKVVTKTIEESKEYEINGDNIEEGLRLLIGILNEGGFRVTIHAERIPEEDK